MSLEQYNNLMSDMLNQRRALVKLRAELEGRTYRKCSGFGHLAQRCRSGREMKKMMTKGNRFEALSSRVMQCGVREMKWQVMEEKGVKYFVCREKGHKKWECPRKDKKSREMEVAPPQAVWEKVKLHSCAKVLPPQEATISMEG